MDIKTTLHKLSIDQLNPMQEEAGLAITHGDNVLLLSPTGSGKTLAFLMPLMLALKPGNHGVQVLVLAPSRELAIQIETVARSMATGHKVNVIYGGRPIKKDFQDLATLPALLIGTPGRIADHLRRGTVDGKTIHTLVLDEYDKSLEIGFEDEMSELYGFLPELHRRVLTSATMGVDIPDWLGIDQPLMIDYLSDGVSTLEVQRVVSSQKDKLDRLYDLLCHLGSQRGIIFLNYKDSIQRTSDYLRERGIDHGVFYGGLDQHDRERALLQFRNGSHRVLLATDLAARGIDVPELDYIIHYHLPLKAEEFTHRNGRTARMHQEGTAYVLHWSDDVLPDFVPTVDELVIDSVDPPPSTSWQTIFISGGRQDKISKGDIVGFLIKVGGLASNELGLITLKQDCAFVAVDASRAAEVVDKLNDQRVKKRKVRVHLI